MEIRDLWVKVFILSTSGREIFSRASQGVSPSKSWSRKDRTPSILFGTRILGFFFVHVSRVLPV